MQFGVARPVRVIFHLRFEIYHYLSFVIVVVVHSAGCWAAAWK